MHVLFITGEFPPMQGGVGDCTNEIAIALVKRGVQVTVLTTEAGGRRTEDEAFESECGGRTETNSFQVLRTIRKWDWAGLGTIRRTIDESQPDIFHIQYQTGAYGMHPMINFAPRRLALAGTRAKSVVTFHDLAPMYLFPKAGRLRDRVTFYLARTSDAVIATNQEDYTALTSRNLKRLFLIPIGSNIAPTLPVDFNRARLRTQLGVEAGEILLCYFGFLNESKGGATLIRAQAEVPNARLLMLGGQTGASDPTNAPYLERVKREIRQLQVQDRVVWTDFLSPSEVSAHLEASDICVLPYRDGASYRRGTFMAALAHGMVIVTTEAKGGGEKMGRADAAKPGEPSLPAIRDGENVLLVPPDDPLAIAAAIRRLAESPELSAHLREGARRTGEFFTWDRIADAHLELYRNLLVR